MTLVIATSGKDFVVLGSDSRATVESGGTRVEINVMEKLLQISDHVAILMCGDADISSYLIDKFKSTLKRSDDGVTRIAGKFADFCRADARRSSGVPILPDFFPNFGFIIAGLDKKGGKYRSPYCYTLGSMNGLRLGLSKRYAIDGKMMIAYYLFVKKYREDMTIPELCALVAEAVHDTISIDGDVGGKIRMAIIDPSGFREIPQEDIDRDYIQPWDLQNLRKIIG